MAERQMTSNQPKRQLSIKSKTPTVSRPWVVFLTELTNALSFPFV